VRACVRAHVCVCVSVRACERVCVCRWEIVRADEEIQRKYKGKEWTSPRRNKEEKKKAK